MKKYVFVFVAVMSMTSCEFLQKGPQPQGDDSAKAAAQTQISELEQKTAELESVLTMLAEIQAGFDNINEAEGRINVHQSGEMKTADRAEMQENMDFITKKLDDNRLKIAELEEKLKDSNFEVDGLKKLVGSLSKQLEDKTGQIVQLNKQLEEKQTQITQLDQTVQVLSEDVQVLTEVKTTQEKTIATQDAMLNRAWYVFGTARELKEQNILKNGEVLTEQDFNIGYFTPIDIRATVEFPLYSKHAELLSTHPEGSWYFDEDEQGKLTLVVADPSMFWSVSKYMVIKVK